MLIIMQTYNTAQPNLKQYNKQHSQKRSKNYHHGDLRTALLDEAVSILTTEGEAGLNIRKLASNVGVSRTALYHHFTSKEELLCAIAEEGFKRFSVILEKTDSDYQFPPTADDDLKQAVIRHLVYEYMAFALEQTAYYDLMFSGKLWKSTQLTASLKQQSYAAFKAFVERIVLWQNKGIIHHHLPALRFAQVCWSALHGMSRLMIDGIYIDTKALDSMCDTLVCMLFTQTFAEKTPIR